MLKTKVLKAVLFFSPPFLSSRRYGKIFIFLRGALRFAKRRKKKNEKKVGLVRVLGRRHSNHVSVFFSVAGAAPTQGQRKKENENLEPIVNGVE